ncbi:DUF805 domain-containing protein [Acuticoccus sp. I52.16.1]|uniref:DUF805 domain-containing protein n=1 Tax=Acuticoccus sp. I52.16.1 TaxID=2928472 RepID=UPI001FD62307|nr:DUF805 domain-containing protein [Acuticoccus sp. I52.16.1]UOM33188.1 DUF805 domain-containing protein [Acuticoccus sp. I52.16.1]
MPTDTRPPTVRPPSIAWALFGFDGRIDREVFWLSNLFCLALTVPIALALPIFDFEGETIHVRYGQLGVVIMVLELAALMWVQVALVVKRLHDRGITGWASLLLAIPVVSLVGFFIIGVVPGERGPNIYGPGPNQRAR